MPYTAAMATHVLGVEVTTADLPDFIAPQLCDTLPRSPAGDDWLHEIKFDGARDNPDRFGL